MADHSDSSPEIPKTKGRTELKIVVWHEYPPMPDRSFDYMAMYDHHDGKPGYYGSGSTPYMAALDLINNINPTEEFSALVKERNKQHGK